MILLKCNYYKKIVGDIMTEKRSGWICPVCKEPLVLSGRSLVCEKKHCFDIAKSGYVNLILSSKSSHGDDKTMIKARNTFLESGHYRALRDLLCEVMTELLGGFRGATVLDAGCGECYYTAAVAEALPDTEVLGIDLSKDALMLGAKRRAPIALAAASVSEIPLAEESCDCVMSVFAPLAAEEFSRVLKDGGVLVQVIPLARHLYGMKKVLYDEPYENKEERDPPQGFVLENERRVCGTIHLSRDQIMPLFSMTPYYYRTGAEGKARLESLDSLDTEIAFGILVYRKA